MITNYPGRTYPLWAQAEGRVGRTVWSIEDEESYYENDEDTGDDSVNLKIKRKKYKRSKVV